MIGFDPLTGTLERDRPADINCGKFAFDALTGAIRWALGIAEFSPLSLFASGEQGTWYDPSDWTTLFQDSAGTTPVTAVEQPVGLMLDKSKGLALGPELVTNGNFSDGATGWTFAGATLVDGKAVFGASVNIQQNGMTFIAGLTYKIDFDVTAYTAGAITISLALVGSSVSSTITSVTPRRYSVYLQSTGNTRVQFASNSTGNFSIDNISVVAVAGNHASQPTTTSRPILRNLYNLLTYTEQFDNAAWKKQNASVVANQDVAPDGTLTADRITTTASNSVYQTVAVTASTSYILSFYSKNNGGTSAGYRVYNNSTPGDIIASTSYFSSINNFSYTKISVSFTTPAGCSSINVFAQSGPVAGVDLFVWGASLVPAEEASLPYQRVVTNTLGSGVYDSDVTKFPPYLYFDGTDDFLVTGSINFSATDKMSVFAGVRKLSDAATAIVCELSASYANAGTFVAWAPEGATVAGRSFGFGLNGSQTTYFQITSDLSPTTKVMSCNYDIGGVDRAAEVSPRLNGAIPTLTGQGNADAGAGNFGAAYPLYIGRRAGTSLPLNGRIYSLITRGALTETPLLEKTEQWVATKTGVTL